MSSALLELQGVSKRFGDLAAVDNLSFSVQPGEVFGFLGPNGAGKTTTLRMVMEITRPDQGTIRFQGAEAIDRTRVGYLPEERGLFADMPALDTLAYLGELRGMSGADARRAARAWLERFELGDRLKSKVGTLSKGNQQKIQFAGAVLHDPVLAVLDEPFSGLDPLNQELAMGVMRELRQRGTAVLLSAHQLDLVERLADRFLLLARGGVVLAGTLDEIRRKATGGADLVLRLELTPRVGIDGVEQALRAAAPDARIERSANTGGRSLLELAVPPAADLGPLLAAAGAHAVVHQADTHRLPLHEIYVRSVSRDRAEREAMAQEVSS
jgi:ABC-2 type transport system ATP-binding protein